MNSTNNTPTLAELEQKRTDWLDAAKERGMFKKLRLVCAVHGEQLDDFWGGRWQYETRIDNAHLVAMYRYKEHGYHPKDEPPRIYESWCVRIGSLSPTNGGEYRNPQYVWYSEGQPTANEPPNNMSRMFYVPGDWEKRIETAAQTAQAQLDIEAAKPDELRYAWLTKVLNPGQKE